MWYTCLIPSISKPIKDENNGLLTYKDPNEMKALQSPIVYKYLDLVHRYRTGICTCNTNDRKGGKSII